jgi:pimeloyl-ACP methyl ester carboxylesterase
MVARPTSTDTRYAKSGDYHIAYQVHGSGEVDLVWTPSYFSHIEVQMEESSFRRFVDRLATFARVILFDKRGTGLSDRVAELPGLDDRMDDFRAVLDAIGSESAALLGTCEGGALSALFAATYPERTRALILANSFARATTADDYPWAESPEEWQEHAAWISETWGSGQWLDRFAPSAAHDPRVQEWWPRFQRLAVSPSAIRTLLLMNAEIDVRDVLASVNVPTLVMHSAGDQLCAIGGARYMSERVPKAQFVQLPGADHYIWFGPDADQFADEIERFLTGTLKPVEPDRALVTVLFVDIVDSTRKAAELGDRAWRDLIDAYYGVVSDELERNRGRMLDTAGDGVLAAVDGPARAIRAGLGIVERVQRYGLTVRAGVHTGEAEIVGDDLRGITVHIGSRLASQAGESELLVSSTVKDLVVGSAFGFVDRGSHEFKGVPNEWRLYAVTTP